MISAIDKRALHKLELHLIAQSESPSTKIWRRLSTYGSIFSMQIVKLVESWKIKSCLFTCSSIFEVVFFLHIIKLIVHYARANLI